MQHDTVRTKHKLYLTSKYTHIIDRQKVTNKIFNRMENFR